MKIWLDDVRPAPNGWLWCRSVNEAKMLIEKLERVVKREEKIALLSLDHDLGGMAVHGGDGIKLMDWLLERGTLYPLQFHTANPVGRANMERMYKRCWLKETL